MDLNIYNLKKINGSNCPMATRILGEMPLKDSLIFSIISTIVGD